MFVAKRSLVCSLQIIRSGDSHLPYCMLSCWKLVQTGTYILREVDLPQTIRKGVFIDAELADSYGKDIFMLFPKGVSREFS